MSVQVGACLGVSVTTVLLVCSDFSLAGETLSTDLSAVTSKGEEWEVFSGREMDPRLSLT